MKLVSLFTGAGGLDLGLEAAGFHTRVAVEKDPAAVATIRANRKWTVIPEDILLVSPTLILRKAGLRAGEADLLAGGPPCQPFSKSGYWHRGSSLGLEDPRAETLTKFLEVLRTVRPKVFLFENVPGARKQRDAALRRIKEQLRTINGRFHTRYSISVRRLDSAGYGVPQHRERILVVGHREGVQFDFPEATHGSNGNGLKPLVTAWDAIGDLEDDEDASLRPNSYWADLLPSIPEGSNYLFHTDRGGGKPLFGWRTRYWSFLLKLSKRRPSWTITATPGPATGPFHWKNRRLSMRELCRLQTFPDGYRVVGTLNAIQRQVGNAVPSALAELLGLEIRYQLFGDERARQQARKLVPRRRREPIPPAERTRPVSSKYWGHIGEHKPHPGEGKGPGALKRRKREVA